MADSSNKPFKDRSNYTVIHDNKLEPPTVSLKRDIEASLTKTKKRSNVMQTKSNMLVGSLGATLGTMSKPTKTKGLTKSNSQSFGKYEVVFSKKPKVPKDV